VLFLIYRLLVAIYAVVITFLSIFHYPVGRLSWPVWLTNLSYLLVTFHLVCAAVIVLVYTIFKDQQSSDSTVIPCSLKFNWLLFCIACPIAILVTLTYFAALFPHKNLDYVPEVDINLHLINSVLVILEFTISALPVRLLHVVYAFSFGLAYVIFSVIYWSVDHANYLYPGVLDWNAPVTSAVVSVVLLFVGIPLMHLILFAIYQLRMSIYSRCVDKQLHESPSVQLSSVNSSSDQWLRY